MARHVGEAVIGAIFCAAVYLALAKTPLPVMLIAYALHVVVGGFNIVLFVFVVIMIALAIRFRRPGFAVAPFLFAAIWFSVAVIQRVKIDAEADPKLAERSAPAELATLIIESQGTQTCCGQAALLAAGKIDRYVYAALDQNFGLARIESYSLGRGEQCSAEDRNRSVLLARAGRTDECLRLEVLQAMPDGVVVRLHYFAAYSGAVGCCNRGTISVRENGSERFVSTWYYGKRPVMSFLPLFGTHGWGQAQPLWSQGGGPTQLVEIGGPEFRQEDLAAAIYRIDWRAAPAQAVVSPAELSRRASMLVQSPKFGDRLPAIEIVNSLQDRGYIDDDLIGVMAGFVEFAGRGLSSSTSLLRFWQRLNHEDKRKFLDRVFARLEDPEQGQDFNSSDLLFDLRNAEFAGYNKRAEDLFASRGDLKPWQYELALRMTQPLSQGFRTPQYFERQRKLFEVVQDDAGSGFARHAIGFKRVYFMATDEERAYFAQQLHRVPDKLLVEYLRVTGFYPTDLKPAPGVLQDYRARARTRIAAVEDEKERRQMLETLSLNRPD